MLRCMEPPYRPALENHEHRIPTMGLRVLITASWYKSLGLVYDGCFCFWVPVESQISDTLSIQNQPNIKITNKLKK